MDNRLESPIQKDIIDYLEAIGAKVFRLNSGFIRKNVRMCPAGTPDLLACLPGGRTLWIEVKKSDGRRSDKQIKMHYELDHLGQKVVVARSVKGVEYAVKEIWGKV